MPWTVEFKPRDDQSGDVVAVFDDGVAPQFTFTGSVNIDYQNSIDDFVAKANAAKDSVAVAETKEAELSVKIQSVLTDKLNSGE